MMNIVFQVSLKHTAVEVINSLDYNLCMGLKEMHLKIKETVENQKVLLIFIAFFIFNTNYYIYF